MLQSNYVSKLTLYIGLCFSFLFIASCSNDQGINNRPINPCLDTDLIDSIKKGVFDNTESLIVGFFGQEVLNSKLLEKSSIKFENISQSEQFENDEISCSARVVVDYNGNTNTENFLASRMIYLADVSKQYYTNPFAFTGFNTDKLRTYAFFGVDHNTIGNYSNLIDNSFAYDLEYSTKTTFSESGESNRIYEADIKPIGGMLATMISEDIFYQAENGLINKSNFSNLVEQEEVVDEVPDDQMVYVDELADMSKDDVLESERFLSDSYAMAEYKELLTEKNKKDFDIWLNERDEKCSNNNGCLYNMNYEKGNEFRIMAGLNN
jgi:hypothetical protein